MNLKRKAASIVAATAILFGMTGGMALALPELGDDEAVLSVTCTPAASVGVALGGPFEVDLASGPGPYSDSINDGAVITVDMTCNHTEGWVVSTFITDFAFQGVAPAGKAQTFPGNSFYMDGGGLTSYTPGPTHGPGNAPPLPNVLVVVPNLPILNIALTTELLIFDWAAPGLSVATWDTYLVNVPSNIAVGTYEADLTVVLYVP